MKVVNNDYPQSATERCSITMIALKSGNHLLYIEGWSSTASLSVIATYMGKDVQNNKLVIPGFWECDQHSPDMEETSLFKICGYKADNDINLGSTESFYMYYTLVNIHSIYLCILLRWNLIHNLDHVDA